jgi:nucleoside-diphosphate-sugar epimerase
MERATLVTGGAGYIGMLVAEELLAAGHEVRVLDSLLHDQQGCADALREQGVELLVADIRDADARAEALRGVEAVVHLAAIVGDPACALDEPTAHAVNVIGATALIDDAAAAGVGRFVFASTCSNYGRMTDPLVPVTEEGELAPVSLYAEQKVAVERALLGLDPAPFAVTCLRFATVYGVAPRMRFDLTVNEFTRDALLTGELVVYGEQFWRPYVHVRDAARAIVVALEAASDAVGGEVFNVGATDQNFRKQDLVDLLVARLPDTKIERVARAEDPRDYRVSFEKIRAVLGFAVTRTVAEGIDEVLALLRSGAVADPFGVTFRN